MWYTFLFFYTRQFDARNVRKPNAICDTYAKENTPGKTEEEAENDEKDSERDTKVKRGTKFPFYIEPLFFRGIFSACFKGGFQLARISQAALLH